MRRKSAVILYGPPAAGKDTIGRALEELGLGYTHFPRLKVGGDRVPGYRHVTEAEFGKMRERGNILYSNGKYGALYAVDRLYLDQLIERGCMPVVHLGQAAGISALTQGYPAHWLIIGLWCSKKETARRLKQRADARLAERLAVWDETLKELREVGLGQFTLIVNTGSVAPSCAAYIIAACESRAEE